ncbi:MAG: HAMP domain-containing protein [Bauldia sp.]|nr:HAMP domain-containing protein [Bauldia sp.]
MKRLSVSARLILLIAIAALPVFLLYVWSALDQRRSVLDAAEDQLLRSARLLAAQQDQYFLRARNVMSTVLRAAAEIGTADPGCSPLLTSIADADETFAFLGLATPDGTIVCGSIPEAVGVNISERTELIEALATGVLAVGPPRQGQFSHRPILPLALPAQTAGGGTTLVAVASLDLDGLSSTLAQSTLPAAGVGIIFNGTRSILARVPATATVDDAVFAPVRGEIATESGGAGLVRSEAVDGVSQIWAVADLLADQGLFVAIGIPVPQLVASADRNLMRGIGILVGVFILAAIAAWLVGESTIRYPLRRLVDAAGSLRRGNFSVRIADRPSAPELRNLGDAFNAMADAIERDSAELVTRNEKLNQAIGEKDMLVREMNHRIKNSLQLVSSMVSLQLATVSDADARASLSAAQGRVAAVAKVHERLYAGQRLDRVEVVPYLDDLAKDLSDTLGLPAAGGSVSVRAVDLVLSPDKVIPLGLIACELVTNAVKHGPPGGAVNVEVALEREGDRIRLDVSDDGPGLPEGFDPAAQPGLGMKVIRALAMQLGGRLEVGHPPQGTTFSIRFPAE